MQSLKDMKKTLPFPQIPVFSHLGAQTCWPKWKVPPGTRKASALVDGPCNSVLQVQDIGIKKLWYIHTMEYYSAIKRNAFESVLMRWMNLEPIIQSKVSQREKDKYCILTHIYGI